MNKYEIFIEQDNEADNPCRACGIGHLATFGKAFSGLGEEGWDSPDALYKAVEEAVKQGGVALPVYGLIHSGITISTEGFNDPWDSGHIGTIWMTAEEMHKEGLMDKVQAESALKDQIRVLARWCEGDVWQYVIRDANGKVVASTAGYYGKEAAEADAKEALKRLMNENRFEVPNGSIVHDCGSLGLVMNEKQAHKLLVFVKEIGSGTYPGCVEKIQISKEVFKSIGIAVADDGKKAACRKFIYVPGNDSFRLECEAADGEKCTAVFTAVQLEHSIMEHQKEDESPSPSM